MDFRLGERSDAFRDEAWQFLDAHLTDEVREGIHTTGVYHNRDFHRARAEHGLLAPGWPEEFGGQGRDPLEVLAFGEAFQNAGAPTYAVGTTLMVANIIRHVGNDAQKREILPSCAPRGDHHRARLHRAGIGLRRGGRADPRGARRGRVGDQRAEDVHHQRTGGGLRLPAHSHQSRRAEAQGTDHLRRSAGSAGCRDPAGVHRVR